MRPRDNTTESPKEPPPTAISVIGDMENEVRTVPELGSALVILIESGLRTGLSKEDCKAAGRVARLLVDFADLIETGWERAFELSTEAA